MGGRGPQAPLPDASQRQHNVFFNSKTEPPAKGARKAALGEAFIKTALARVPNLPAPIGSAVAPAPAPPAPAPPAPEPPVAEPPVAEPQPSGPANSPVYEPEPAPAPVAQQMLNVTPGMGNNAAQPAGAVSPSANANQQVFSKSAPVAAPGSQQNAMAAAAAMRQANQTSSGMNQFSAPSLNGIKFGGS